MNDLVKTFFRWHAKPQIRCGKRSRCPQQGLRCRQVACGCKDMGRNLLTGSQSEANWLRLRAVHIAIYVLSGK